MLNRLRSLYRHQNFFPNWLGLLVNPFYFARAGLCGAMTELAPRLQGKLLDVGCGSKPYRQLFSVDSYVGLDIDSEVTRQLAVADYLYDGNAFPLQMESFDSVLCNQVLEHVFNPDQFLEEIARVLKPGGCLLLTVPFVWDEHEQPNDFARYSSFGLRSLLERHGFEIVEQRKSTDDIRVIFQMLNAYLFKKMATRSNRVNLLLTLLMMAPLNVLGELLFLITPRNPDLYLDNIVLARKLEQE